MSGLVTSCARVAAQLRCFHGDLGSGDHQLSRIERQPGENLHGIEPADQHGGAQREPNRHRDRQPQEPHPPAVPRGALERTPFIAPFADGEAATSRSLDCGGGGQALYPRGQTQKSRESPKFASAATFISRFKWLKIGLEYGPVAAKRHEWAKMSSGAQPARSNFARSGRKWKQAAASSVRPSRASMTSSLSFSAWRWSTSDAA